MPIGSYSKIRQFGHPETADLLNVAIQVEEKIDGSQFSWMKDSDGVLHFRSRNSVIYPEAADKLFQPSVLHLISVADKIPANAVFRGEAVCSTRHNHIKYDRVPSGHIVLFDVEDFTTEGIQFWWNPIGIETFAGNLNIEPVKVFETLDPDQFNVEYLTGMVGQESQLGNKAEGIVIKPLQRNIFSKDGKLTMAKMVREDFQEEQKKSFKSENKNSQDIILMLQESFGTEARWRKAVQHLDEEGKLERDPKDIGLLIKEVQEDVKKECKDAIQEVLFNWAWKRVSRGLFKGLPEWYKQKLIKDLENNE